MSRRQGTSLEYYPDMWLKRGKMLAPLFRRECGRMSFWQTASDNVNGPSRKWYRLIQTSWSPYDIYTAFTKQLGVVITQDNWPIAFLVDSLRRAINKQHHQTRALSQISSAECCGDTNIRLYQPNLIRDSRADTQQITPLDNTLTGICPWDHLYVRIYNTVADATIFNNPKVDLTI